MLQPIWGSNSPNFGGVNRFFSSQMRQILKRSYYQNYCNDHNQILHSDRDHALSIFPWWSDVPQSNPRWRTAAILKNQKSQYLCSGLTDIWRNVAWWTASRSPNKISRLQKSKMTAAAILKIRNTSLSPQRIYRFWLNLAWWCVSALWTSSANKISRIRKF